MGELLSLIKNTGAKLILAGDSGQLHPIKAGSGLSLVSTLIETRRVNRLLRQENGAQIEMVKALVALSRADKVRSAGAFGEKTRGEPDDLYGAVRQFVQDECWHVVPHPRDAIARAVAMSLSSIEAAVRGSMPQTKLPLIMVKSNAEARSFTQLMRRKLHASGHLEEREICLRAKTPTGRTCTLKLSVGDLVRFRKRERSLELCNGSLGRITQINGSGHDAELCVAVVEDGIVREVAFSIEQFEDDLQRVDLCHAYATTVYSAQGLTCETAILVKSRLLNFREFYVAVTRAQKHCDVIEVDTAKSYWMTDPVDIKRLSRAVVQSLIQLRAADRPRTPIRDFQKKPLAPATNLERHPWQWDCVVDLNGKELIPPKYPEKPVMGSRKGLRLREVNPH